MDNKFSPSPLDEVLLKQHDTLNDQDRELIKQNLDKLNDDERTRFSDLFPKEEEPKEVKPQIDDTIKKAELDSYLEQKRKEWEAAGASKQESKEQADRVEQFLKEKGEPKNWNDTFKMMRDYIKANPDEFASVFKEQIEGLTKKEQAEIEERTNKVTTEWESAYAKVAEKDGMPKLTTKAGKEALSEIAQLMVDYNNYDFSKMYDLYTKLHPKTEAIEEAKDTKTPETDTKQVRRDTYRRAANLVGGGSGAAERGRTKPSYAEIAKGTYASLTELGLQRTK